MRPARLLLLLPALTVMACDGATSRPRRDGGMDAGEGGDGGDGGARDAAMAADAGPRDLRFTSDLVTPSDPVRPIDLAPPPDLSVSVDAVSPGDAPGPFDLAAPVDLARPVDIAVPVDLARPVDLITPVDLGAPCTSQAGCAALADHYCAPISAGSAQGRCLPRSPMHCASCAGDADCGSSSERCTVAPGDTGLACHIDCALAGASACPPDYSCAAVNDGGQPRMLCLPQNTPICLDALGGWCDRVTAPQPCWRSAAPGTCTGDRTCLAGSQRYSACSAATPQYLPSCGALPQANCVEQVDPSVLGTPADCGACGNSCPGQGQATAEVQCADPANLRCGMTCRGENYDVNGNPADGCEILDDNSATPHHTQATALSRGTKPCDDAPSQDTFSGRVPSDARQHQNPTVSAFSGTVGAAPDWWRVLGSGGTFCVNDYAVTFTTSGGGNATCYSCTIITSVMSQTVSVSGNGTMSMSSGFSSYGSGTNIHFRIEKTCSLPVQENVQYTVSYHL